MNDCCADLENRSPTEKVSDDLTFTCCTVCGARHFELVIDEAELVSEITEA